MGLLSCFGFEEGVAWVLQDLLAGGLHEQVELECTAWPCENKLSSLNSLRLQVDCAHKSIFSACKAPNKIMNDNAYSTASEVQRQSTHEQMRCM
jgi:hypothetical protein